MQEDILRQLIRDVLMEAGFVPDWKKKEYNSLISRGFKIMRGEDEGKDDKQNNKKDKIFAGDSKAEEIINRIKRIKGSPKDSASLNAQNGKLHPKSSSYNIVVSIEKWLAGASGSYEGIMKYKKNGKIWDNQFKGKYADITSYFSGNSVLMSEFKSILYDFLKLLENKNMNEAYDFQWFQDF